jgi:hypothetical protein
LWSQKLQYLCWGETYCPNLKSKLYFPPGNTSVFPLIEEQIDPTVWTDGTTVVEEKIALPVQIKLKDPLQFPHQKQYPLKPDGQHGILPIINSLKQQGLLMECSSPYNSPILAVSKGANKWRLVQDL